jgi:hypothetical protein
MVIVACHPALGSAQVVELRRDGGALDRTAAHAGPSYEFDAASAAGTLPVVLAQTTGSVRGARTDD